MAFTGIKETTIEMYYEQVLPMPLSKNVTFSYKCM